ncbi:heavy metal-binding protein HIP-like [Mercenaria mercenaria]|uniref:heavy metal-binding protein HIP-like n=1 Tax=Mercenaria mercenaria TaxID=6596 RepID=UPI00234E3E42|nr:heavy metal-binding protein HIP-like [Mercenaria mercenaria]
MTSTISRVKIDEQAYKRFVLETQVLKLKGGVSFLVTLSHSVTGCLPGKTIVFDSIKINHGSAYNKTNGRFTAPRSGTYQIGVTLCASPHHDFTVQIVKNVAGRGYGYLFLEGGSHWEHRSTSSMIHLDAGDSIWISCLRNSTVHGQNDGNAYDYNSHFSGFLIEHN